MESQKPFVGGQAVIEGVMMRGPKYVATAVREPSGAIALKKEPLSSITDRYPVLKKPILRGVVALVEALIYGMQALSFSAQAAGAEDEEITTKEIVVTMGLAFGLAVLLFVIIPTYAAKYIHSAVTEPWALNLFEGVLRITIFLLYVVGISLIKDIGRVFEYHGAEHKTIHAYEAGLALEVENIRPLSRIHPRCGTNFLFIVMILSIFMFSFLGWPDLWLRIASRILLLPLVAGLAYEFIRFAGRNQNRKDNIGRLVAFLIAPGFYLQYLTTREPGDDQIEVAIEALEAVKPE